MKLSTNVKVHFFPKDEKKWADTYERDMKRSGTFLGRVDYGDVEAVVEMADFDFAFSIPTIVAGVRAQMKDAKTVDGKAGKE